MLCAKRFLYTTSIVYKIVVLFYTVIYLNNNNYKLTNEEIITLVNIIICIPLDMCVVYYKKLNSTLSSCISIFIVLFLTPLISTLYVINDLAIHGNDFRLKLLIITCYFYNMFVYIIFYCIDCFNIIDYDEEKKIKIESSQHLYTP